MAVRFIIRKRTLAIVIAPCLAVFFILYMKSERITTKYLKQAREAQRDETSRFDDSVIGSTEAVSTTAALPTKTYSVVHIEEDEEEDEEEEKKKKKAMNENELAKKEQKNKTKDELKKESMIAKQKKKIEVKRKPKRKEDVKGKAMEGMEDEVKGEEVTKKDQKKVEWDQEVKLVEERTQRNKELDGGKNDRNVNKQKTEEKKNRNDLNKQDGKRQGYRTDREERVGQSSNQQNNKRTEDFHNDESVKESDNENKELQTVQGKRSNSVLNSSKVTSKPSRNIDHKTANRNLKTKHVNPPTSSSTWASKSTTLNNPRLKQTRHSEIQRQNNPNVDKPTAAANNVSLACKVPKLDPFHPHVFPLLHDVGTNLRKRCLNMHPRLQAFKVVGNKLVLRDGADETKIVKKSVKLREIVREGDSYFTYKAPKNPFRGVKSLRESNSIGDSDFFRVDYEIKGGVASDLHARVAPLVDTLEKQMKKMKDFKGKGIPLNVLIIGFDSTSRANFERKMGRVVSFLKTQLNTYVMEGMSVVGDATTPILTAMLTGKYENEVPEGRRSYGGRPIDNWPWIMKDYEKQGYMTLFAEDDPGVSSFNLRLEGFRRSPTHHYMRPFWLSLEQESERDEPGLCSNSNSMTNLTLKYVMNFFDTYPTARKFAFGFMSYLAHAHPNHLSYAENDLLWFLRTFVNQGYSRDTMVIIMGDHGSRNAEYRGTMQGKLEERLPWFSISLPSKFHRSFPDLAANLRSNQDIISSSFDVHATLRHMLTYPEVPSGEHTQSLFQRLPRNRTCADAGIAEHWCPCLRWSPAKVNSTQVKKVALAAVDYINKQLSNIALLQTSCHQLTLDSIEDAVRLQANKGVQRFHFTYQDGDRSVHFTGRTTDYLRYQVIFSTRPNDGKYEVTASVSGDDKVKVNPEISRINRYNDQPKCIARQYPYARKFCFCRTTA